MTTHTPPRIPAALLALFATLAVALLAPSAGTAAQQRNGPFVLSLNSCYLNRYLATLPARGGELTPITPECADDQEDDDGVPSYAFPDAAPDGRSVLALSETFPQQYVQVQADGSGITPVVMPAGVDTTSLSAPSFAPDGKRFAFESDRYANGYDTQPLLEARRDGTAGRVIREAEECGKRKSCNIFEDPRWSPDGKVIAVTVTAYGRRPRLQSGLWLIRADDGKAIRRLSRHVFLDAAWAPDGRHLVYATRYSRSEFGGASGGNLYVVGRDGKGTRTLVHRKRIAETQPVWSPDGKSIAWISLEFGPGDVSPDVRPKLWTIPAKGGKRKLIQRLPQPYVEEGEYDAPQLTWLAR